MVTERPEGTPSEPDWRLAEDLVLSEADPHPTPRLHGIIARAIFRHLEESGLLASLLAR